MMLELERVQNEVADCAAALREVGALVTVLSLQRAMVGYGTWTPAHTMVARWYVNVALGV